MANWLFIWIPCSLWNIEDMLANGSHMSYSLNDKHFLSLIILQTINIVFRSELLQTDKLNLYFYINKLICWMSLFCVFPKHRTFLFFLEKSELSCFGVGWNCTSQKAKQDSSKAQMSRCSPIEIFLFMDFLTPWFLATSFFFWSCAAWKLWDRYCKMGPTCHPLCTIKVSFRGLFLTPDIWSLAFFLSIPCKMGPACRPLFTKKVSFLGVIFYPNLWLLPFFYPLPPLKLWGLCWLMGPTCQPLWTINLSSVNTSIDELNVLEWAFFSKFCQPIASFCIYH